MGLALFFVVFSCPVKKYIRMQLYKHYPPTEQLSLERLGIPEGKDCSIADKHNQALALSATTHHFSGDSDGLLMVILPALIFTALSFLNGRKQDVCAPHGQDPGSTSGAVPLYLRHRRFRV
jgi:hypothetical protein